VCRRERLPRGGPTVWVRSHSTFSVRPRQSSLESLGLRTLVMTVDDQCPCHQNLHQSNRLLSSSITLMLSPTRLLLQMRRGQVLQYADQKLPSTEGLHLLQATTEVLTFQRGICHLRDLILEDRTCQDQSLHLHLRQAVSHRLQEQNIAYGFLQRRVHCLMRTSRNTMTMTTRPLYQSVQGWIAGCHLFPVRTSP